MRVERSTTIDQPVDRVFEYVSTPENDPTWVPASLRHEMLSPPPMRVGSITEGSVVSREAHALHLGDHALQAAEYLRPAKRLRSDSRYHLRPARVLRWCPHQGHISRRGAVGRSLQADGASDEVDGPMAVRNPAAHTKESAGERSPPIRFTLGTGESVNYKHIDELTREDRKARMAAERKEVEWFIKCVELCK